MSALNQPWHSHAELENLAQARRAVKSPQSLKQIIGTGLDGPGGLEALRKEMQRYDRALGLDLAAERILCLHNVTGVAIALEDGPDLRCVASAGTAPPLGTLINVQEGLSGECIRSGHTIYCSDAFSDARVDPALADALELGSILVVPVLRGKDPIGLLEVFSSTANTFGAHTRSVLEAVAELVASTYGVSPAFGKTVLPPPVILPEAIPAPVIAVEPTKPHAAKGLRGLPPEILASAIAIAAVLTVVLGVIFIHPHSAPPAVDVTQQVDVQAPPAPEKKHSRGRHNDPVVTAKSNKAANTLQAAKIDSKSTVNVADFPDNGAVEVGDLGLPSSTGGKLIKQVLPSYPEAARKAGVSGAVELEAAVNERGDVTSVHSLSGASELRDAAEQAVRNWRYEPLVVNGKAMARKVKVEVRFKN